MSGKAPPVAVLLDAIGRVLRARWELVVPLLDGALAGTFGC